MVEEPRPPVPEHQSLEFLNQLHEGITADFIQGAANYIPISLPPDYGILLTHANGLNDTDLRRSGELGISGTLNANIQKMTGYTPHNIPTNLYNTDNLPHANSHETTGWEVYTGFILSGLTYREDPDWLYYYYCARTNTSANPWHPYPNHSSTTTTETVQNKRNRNRATKMEMENLLQIARAVSTFFL
jgi:hypothetical protein